MTVTQVSFMYLGLQLRSTNDLSNCVSTDIDQLIFLILTTLLAKSNTDFMKRERGGRERVGFGHALFVIQENHMES